MTKRILCAGAALTGASLLLLFPIIHIIIVLGNFALHLLVLGLQLATACLPKVSPKQKQKTEKEPFVSIHVPAHNEPPDVLRETLTALSKIKWNNYEVIVIDNNTSDENLWRPIEALCRELGGRFRFFHVENMQGAKAGALNYVRKMMNPQAEFIFVVDADYVVEEDVLCRSFQYVSGPRVGLVQFPQEYRNVGPGNAGIAVDFRHFFAGYMNMANHLGCVPSTGTLSLIRVAALKSVGGFDTQVVTEDADLGLKLNSAGWESVYANEVVGRGLMPHDLESLKKQRWRWAFGNAQILKLNWKRLLLGRDLTLRQKLGYLIHLTAWFNFNFIPSVSLVLIAPAAGLHCLHPLQPYILVIASFTLVSFMVLKFGTLFYSLRADGCRTSEIWLAFLTHLGLGSIFSMSWLKCLFDHNEPFIRTNKFLTRNVPGVLRTTIVELLQGASLLIACIVLTASDFVFAPAIMFVMFVCQSLVYWVWWQTQLTWKATEKLINEVVNVNETLVEEVEQIEPFVPPIPPGGSW